MSGIPTAKLRERLRGMTHRAGLALIAVDPAYTSRWGKQHWQKPTSAKKRKTTVHEAAAIVIGRRSQNHKARRRVEKTGAHQSDAHRGTITQGVTDGAVGLSMRTPGEAWPPDGVRLPWVERFVFSRATVTPALPTRWLACQQNV